jgi:hypothetical protein
MKLNLKYCLRREMGHCCVLWQVCQQFEGSAFGTPTIAGGNVANGEAGLISDGWSFHSWTLGASTGAAAKTLAQNDIGFVDAGCTTDYLEIPDSTTGVKNFGAATQAFTRYCGHRFGNVPAIVAAAGTMSHAPVWDCTEPFEATYYTDTVNDNGIQDANAPPTGSAATAGLSVIRGMCLDFQQVAC